LVGLVAGGADGVAVGVSDCKELTLTPGEATGEMVAADEGGRADEVGPEDGDALGVEVPARPA
jgi:hypothetical protein